MTTWTIRAAADADVPDWSALRASLWPDDSVTTHARDARATLRRPRAIALLAFDAASRAIGFAEATLRVDYVNGTDTSPVGFLEGWYVAPSWRSRGVGRALLAQVERWTREHGCSELASDSWLDHPDSQRAHLACGFEETERVVYFRKAV